MCVCVRRGAQHFAACLCSDSNSDKVDLSVWWPLIIAATSWTANGPAGVNNVVGNASAEPGQARTGLDRTAQDNVAHSETCSKRETDKQRETEGERGRAWARNVAYASARRAISLLLFWPRWSGSCKERERGRRNKEIQRHREREKGRRKGERALKIRALASAA